jgi:hypothetical protein
MKWGKQLHLAYLLPAVLTLTGLGCSFEFDGDSSKLGSSQSRLQSTASEEPSLPSAILLGVTPPELQDPIPDATFVDTAVDFSWCKGTYEQFNLDLGSAPGGWDLGYSRPTEGEFWSILGLPADGRPIYARLWYKMNTETCSLYSSCSYIDYEYNAHFGILTPAKKTALVGTQTTFAWDAHYNAVRYAVDVGDQGVGSYNLAYGSTTDTHWQNPVSKPIPTDGRMIYARLWYKPATSGCIIYWNCPYVDQLYYAQFDGLTSPSAGSLLAAQTLFKWGGHHGADEFGLKLGDTGPGSNNIATASASDTWWTNPANHSIAQDGRTINLRLSHRPTGSSCLLFSNCPYFDYSFSANSGPGYFHKVTFDWEPRAGSVRNFIRVGSSPGTGDYCAASLTGTTVFECANVSAIADRVYWSLFYFNATGGLIDERHDVQRIFPAVDPVAQSFSFSIF